MNVVHLFRSIFSAKVALIAILFNLVLAPAIQAQENGNLSTRGAIAKPAGFGVPLAKAPKKPHLPTVASTHAPGIGPVTAAVNEDLIVGETGNISIRANHDLHLRVFLITANKQVTQFYPNHHNPGTLVPFSQAHGQPFTIPFLATANPGGQTGDEQFRIYFSKDPFSVDGVGKKKDGFDTYEKAKVYTTRGGIALKAGFGPAPKSHQKPTVKLPVVKAKIFELKIGYVLKHH